MQTVGLLLKRLGSSKRREWATEKSAQHCVAQTQKIGLTGVRKTPIDTNKAIERTNGCVVVKLSNRAKEQSTAHCEFDVIGTEKKNTDKKTRTRQKMK
jgi:hypothetical protein